MKSIKIPFNQSNTRDVYWYVCVKMANDEAQEGKRYFIFGCPKRSNANQLCFWWSGFCWKQFSSWHQRVMLVLSMHSLHWQPALNHRLKSTLLNFSNFFFCTVGPDVHLHNKHGKFSDNIGARKWCAHNDFFFTLSHHFLSISYILCATESSEHMRVFTVGARVRKNS